MRTLRRIRPLLVVAALGASVFSFAQSFGNAGFESPSVSPHEFRSGVDTPAFIAPWYGEHSFGIANGSGSWGSAAYSGSQYAYIQSTDEFGGAGSLYQTLTGLAVGERYAVHFWMAERNGDVGGNVANPLAVYADALEILSPTAPIDGTWRSYTTSAFTATATSVTIKFQGKSPNGDDTASLLDDVSLVANPVPEPASFAALAVGIAGTFRRRQRG